MLFGNAPAVQKFFNGYNWYAFIPTELKAPSLKVSRCKPNMQKWGVKKHQKWTKINYNWPYQYFYAQESL